MASAVNKAEKFLEAAGGRKVLSRCKYERIVFVSDSKGRYLEGEVKNFDLGGKKLEFHIFPSRRIKDGINEVSSILKSINPDEKTVVLFWFGTCDITKKEGKFIYQRYNDTKELTDLLKIQFEELLELCQGHSVDTGIIEIPSIFTKEYNKHKGHTNIDIFDDKPINEQVKAVNSCIRFHNFKLKYLSPRLHNDFIISRGGKKKKGGTKYTLDSRILIDGVHPGSTIAKKWLLKILDSLNY
ncbi:hypothetical protein ACF0H5_007820 [Mactra antiquata]